MNGLSGARWWSWQRFVCLALTIAIVAFLLARAKTTALAWPLTNFRWPWFAAAVAMYGLTLVLGGLRWHLALHSIRCAVHAGASIRLAFIGHFFFLVLFGMAAGDVAKSAVYARWYRFGIPELAAAAPIDRTLGLVAALAVGAIAALIGFASGGFQELDLAQFRISLSAFWLVGVAVVAALVAFAFWKPRGEAWWARGSRTLREGARGFLTSPKKLAPGALIAIAAQVAFCSVFALSVRAVAGESLPWLRLAWTFPVVMMLSCLPITIAGAGVREVLAMTFLGLYGVPPSECVGAAVLTFVCKVIWALAGGALLWREAAVQQRFVSTPEPKLVSVVIPALNESESLPATIEHLRKNASIHEVIVVDGGSNDRTPETAEQLGCRLLRSHAGRGGQMRAGAQAARGDVILLLHADTWLSPNATRAMLACLRDRTVVAGGFWKEFRETPLLLLGSKWKCAVRLWMGRRIAGDQAMFIRRDALGKIGGIPEMALMEEFALCSRLRRVGRLAMADAVVLTSARRFRKLGVIRTYLRMWRVGTLYRLGAESGELRRLYEKDT